ncbi:MAG: type II toxin-antitoxin system VapC family toxin, partial [Bifidobacteriaceae bacterium]|nr:type II toxin-antitoxin system VapC family toxin [Bifidobacteriaceae bacterium]
MAIYMLDTDACSFLMRGTPAMVENLRLAQSRGATVAISAIVYSELRDGALGPKASPKHAEMVADFAARLDAIIPWDRAAADHTALVRRDLRLKVQPIGVNDSAIAGHGLAAGATVVTHHT